MRISLQGTLAAVMIGCLSPITFGQVALASTASAASARWITHADAIAADREKQQVALQFRHELELVSTPTTFPIKVSADNRYILYVNGTRVAAGPSRGDLSHWRVQRLDLAPHLRAGSNVVAILVWNEGALAPRAQISARTGLYVEGQTAAASALNSGSSWRVRVDRSRIVAAGMEHMTEQVGGTYYVAGNPETHDGKLKLGGWTTNQDRAKDWSAATDAVSSGAPPWKLVDDRLPQMKYDSVSGDRVVRSSGVDASNFPDRALSIPAQSEVSFVLDAGQVQSAYPELLMDGGRGSTVTVTYTEANYDTAKKRLSDRSRVEGASVLGLTDTYKPDGANSQSFQPFWWRTWRFAEVRVRTADAPLELIGFRRYATGYPFETRAWFKSDDPELDRIWEIGWNTLKVDAHETFMDTSYWEQMQYIGDARIEALLADMVSGDSRLSEQAIRSFDESRTVTSFAMRPLFPPSASLAGLPQAAWPSAQYSNIPPFALLWVGMLHDYHMRWPARELVKDMMPGVRFSLEWFRGHLGNDGLIGPIPGWRFLDWKPNLQGDPFARPTKDDNGCVLSLMYLGALKEAANLEQSVGEGDQASADRDLAAKTAQAIQARCWSPQRQLYSDSPALEQFSQHANLLAVLYDVAPKSQQSALMDRILVPGSGIDAPTGMTPASYYFAFYLARALDHAGLADRYVDLLQSWRDMLRKNFSTWPETPDPARSDTHAWSAHPTADLLTLVAGFKPEQPGFAIIRVEPHLGPLKSLSAGIPHGGGQISAEYNVSGGFLEATLQLPKGLSGSFIWQGKSHPLSEGTNRFRLPDGAQSRAGDQ